MDRLAAVHERIAQAARDAGRRPETVALLAVSKRQPLEAIAALWQQGQPAFGESYLQEALGKVAALAEQRIQPEWHFIGPIQSNKTRAIASHFDWVHSVDREKVARRLSEQRPAGLPPLQLCIEVNTSGEPSKSGVMPEQVVALAEHIVALPHLRLRGLMTIPAPCDNPEQQRRPFRRLAELLAELQRLGHEVDTLSMGMSNDLEAAIAEGATIVRVGTALFGARPA